jgi:hypothetical protein
VPNPTIFGTMAAFMFGAIIGGEVGSAEKSAPIVLADRRAVAPFETRYGKIRHPDRYWAGLGLPWSKQTEWPAVRNFAAATGIGAENRRDQMAPA